VLVYEIGYAGFLRLNSALSLMIFRISLKSLVTTLLCSFASPPNTTAVKVLSSKISLYCPLVSTLLFLSKALKAACTSLLLDVVSNFT